MHWWIITTGAGNREHVGTLLLDSLCMHRHWGQVVNSYISHSCACSDHVQMEDYITVLNNHWTPYAEHKPSWCKVFSPLIQLFCIDHGSEPCGKGVCWPGEILALPATPNSASMVSQAGGIFRAKGEAHQLLAQGRQSHYLSSDTPCTQLLWVKYIAI